MKLNNLTYEILNSDNFYNTLSNAITISHLMTTNLLSPCTLKGVSGVVTGTTQIPEILGFTLSGNASTRIMRC